MASSEGQSRSPEFQKLLDDMDRGVRERMQQERVDRFTGNITGNVEACREDGFDHAAKLELRENLMRLKVRTARKYIKQDGALCSDGR
jgi:hypothetical protein